VKPEDIKGLPQETKRAVLQSHMAGILARLPFYNTTLFDHES
jgi:hypothetical protein